MAFREDVNFGQVRSEKGYFDGAGKKVIAAQQAAIVSLTNANGTGNNALEDVTATPTQAAINNNFRDCSDKINAILVALRAHGLIA